MTVGAINWDLFACPVNVIVLLVYIVDLIAMHLLRKRVYLFSWLSHYSAAVAALLGLLYLVPAVAPALLVRKFY